MRSQMSTSLKEIRMQIGAVRRSEMIAIPWYKSLFIFFTFCFGFCEKMHSIEGTHLRASAIPVTFQRSSSFHFVHVIGYVRFLQFYSSKREKMERSSTAVYPQTLWIG